MSNNHEFILLAPEKMNHYGIDLEAWIPVAVTAKSLGMDLKVCMHKSRIEDAITAGLPEDMIITSKEYNSGDNIYKYVFSDYGPGNPKSVENWYKTQYGHGDENYIYNQMIFWRMKNFRGWICYSKYDCYKLSFKNYFSKGERLFYINGTPKFDDINSNDKRIEKLIERGLDIYKPTILFQHTWDKSAHEYAGYVDYDSMIIDKLRELSNTYNIINKAHHEDSDSRKHLGFIDTYAGEVSSKALYNISSIIISDYGGSALDVLNSYDNTKLIYINSDNLPDTDEISQNLDIIIHKYLPSYSKKELALNFDKIIDEYDISSILPIKYKFKELLYGYAIDNPTNNFIEILKSLSNNSSSEFEYTKDTVLPDYCADTIKELGLVGPPIKVNNRERLKKLRESL